MNNDVLPTDAKPVKTRWWRLIVIVLAAAALIGSVLNWRAGQNGPQRHFRDGLEAFDQDDLDAVRSATEALRDVDGYEPHLHLLNGMLLLGQDRPFKAVEEFGFAKDHPDTRARAYALSGEALYKMRAFGDAERILSAAVKLDPSRTDARRWLAALYYDVGAMNHATEQLVVIARQAPDDARPHRLLGLIYKDFEKYNSAIDAYQESLRRAADQPDKDDLLVELAECLIQQHRREEAIEALDSCPKSAPVLALQAECHYEQGDEAAARELLVESRQLDPDHFRAIMLSARIELETHHVAEAVGVLLEAVERHPKEYQVRYQLVRAYAMLGREDLAQEQADAMQELRQLRKRFTDLHDEAMADPTNAETRFQLALVAAQLDKPELARDWLSMALALDPDHPGARRALEEGTGQPSLGPAGPNGR